MIRQLKQCFLLYLREPAFMIFAILGFLSLCMMQALVYWGIHKNLWTTQVIGVAVGGKQLEIIMNRYALGDDLLTLIFILGSCVMFAFGMLIKKQFANDRASLLPGYRVPHAVTVIGILLLFISAMIFFSKGAMEISQVFFMKAFQADISLGAIYVVILVMAMTMFYIGYLSIAYLVVIGYVALAVVGQNIGALLQFFSSNPPAFGMAVAVLFFSLVIFLYRLLTLKSENFEYPFLLTWPPQKTLRNQMAFQFIKMKRRDEVIPAYFKHQDILARAGHWRYAEESSIFSLLTLTIIGLPFYYLFLKSPFSEYFMTGKVEANLLLLTGAPVLLTIITNYKNMIFWNYDLLKPVSRRDFFKQQGVKFFSDFSVYWLIIAGYFAVIPDALRGCGQIVTTQFWVFLFLTYAFALLNLAWLAALSAKDDFRSVVINGFFLCVLIMAEFFLAGRTSSGWISLNAGLCLIATVLFCKLAFEKWMDKEF